MTEAENEERCARDWLRSLKILHRGHWNAARSYDQTNLLLGIATAVTAAVSGTAAFTQLNDLVQAGQASVPLQVVIGSFGVIAAALAGLQTFFRSSDLATRHKQAAIKFGQVRRELEEQLDLGLPGERDKRESLLTGLREHWGLVDDEAPPVPPRIYRKAAATVETAIDSPSPA